MLEPRPGTPRPAYCLDSSDGEELASKREARLSPLLSLWLGCALLPRPNPFLSGIREEGPFPKKGGLLEVGSRGQEHKSWGHCGCKPVQDPVWDLPCHGRQPDWEAPERGNRPGILLSSEQEGQTWPF